MDQVENLFWTCECGCACQQDDSLSSAQEWNQNLRSLTVLSFQVVCFIHNHDSHIIEHVFHSPSEIIRNDHDLYANFQGSLFIVDKLYLMWLNVWIPAFNLILPVKFERWRANDQEWPFVSVNVSNCQGLDCLTHTHLICKKESSVMLDTKTETFLLELKESFIKRQGFGVDQCLGRDILQTGACISLDIVELNLSQLLL